VIIKKRTNWNSRGFSEIEFVLLVASAVLIAGILAHFVFDQNLQVEKLHTMVARDAVRLAMESRLIDAEVITKSASALPDEPKYANLRACILGEKNCTSLKGHCCQSRSRKAMPILELGDVRKVIAGTAEEPACLDAQGQASNGPQCFATSRVAIDPVCADGKETCKSATAIIIRYQIMFNSPFIKDNPELSTLERSVSLLLDTKGSHSAP
jgi:hypothetical protein